MRSFIYTAYGVVLSAALAGAQPVPPKEPARYAVTEPASRVEARPPGVRLGLRKPPEFALAPLSDSERAVLAGPGPRLRVGVHRALPASVLSTGTWETTPEGARIWRMAIRSPGSLGIRIEFRNFAVGGGKVWLDDGGAGVAGPYTGRGIFDDGRFWSATVFAESVIIEYEPAPGVTPESLPPFEIRTIAHRARAVAAPLATGAAPDPAAYCHLDPNCYPDWKPAMSMVGQLDFETDGYEALCSGAAIATRDDSFKPYLLTAGHCIHSEDSARSLEMYWTYQTQACGGPAPNRDTSTKSTLGAHLVDFGAIEQGDYSLVLLQDVPNGVVFSGWDVTDPPLGTQLTGIHHPAGSWKRISFGERVGDLDVDVEGDLAPAGEYFEIQWDKGRTEPGSSGSPLFSSPGVIVGTLTYGPALAPDQSVCDVAPLINGYGRFSIAYSNLKDYLENLPAAAVTPDKSALNFTVSNHTASSAQVVRLSTASTGQITYKLRADANWIQLSNITGTISANSPGQVTIAIDPAGLNQSDNYASTVTILSGAAPPRFINVAAAVSVSQSNVVESLSPNPVSLSGGLWSFQVRLAETGGAATRVTAMKINGADYSSSIQGWFGTNHIDANGAIVAPVQAPSTLPAGTQYFEFWGMDDFSGQHWYRLATVTLQ